MPEYRDPPPRTAEMTALSSEDLDDGIPAREVGPWTRIGLIAAGGALGAVLSYVLSLLAPYVPSPALVSFPLTTLPINTVGSLGAGIVAGLVESYPRTPAWVMPLIQTGFLSGFTTVSAFSSEFALMIGGNALGPALAYGVASLALPVVFAALGLWIVVTISRRRTGRKVYFGVREDGRV